MDIFGKQLFGSDSVEWLALCKDKKKEWILKYTNQRDENVIDEFVNNPTITKDCKCQDCGKTKKDVNISNTIPKENVTSNEIASTPRDGKRATSKRRNNAKKS